MPIGLTRLNERRQRPNQNITFIKVRDEPDKDIAQDILERVAAIVWPIMRDNHLGVMTLEDFPPNREFWGRNFNAGECIQLVLKSPMTGMWLPFSFVCKVMLHEMAHIKHMNHSKYFHAVRIGYHKELAVLTARGYTGDGFYGRGQSLSTGLTEQREIPDEELPENLCGGAYRKAKTADESRKRKRTYAERQQIRKERLFGKGEGESLGADQEKRMLLEKGKGKGKKAVAVKPRVAQSQRGRDLRAEAALRRLEASKAEASTSAKREQVSAGVKDEEISTDESATEDEQGTVDLGGGNKYVKLEDDDDLQENWKDIRSEVAGLVLAGSPSRAKASTSGRATTPHNNKAPAIMDSSDTERDSDSETAPTPPPPSSQERVNEVQCTNGYTAAGGSTGDTEEESDGDVPARIAAPRPSTSARRSPTLMPSKAEDLDGHSGLPLPPALGATLGADEIACPACTTANGVENILCMVCSCVLDTDRTASWKCTSKFCAGGAFANHEDAGICGGCGQRRPPR